MHAPGVHVMLLASRTLLLLAGASLGGSR